MPTSGLISVPSATGSTTTLNVAGTRAVAFAQMFVSYLDSAQSAGTLSIATPDLIAPGMIGFAAPASGGVNEAVAGPLSTSLGAQGVTITVPSGFQAVFDDVSGASTVMGPATGIAALFGDSDSAGSFIDEGGDNIVMFIAGDDTYMGDTLNAATNDTIVGGAGNDTINTGAGQSTVFSGIGRNVITLNDTIPSATADLVSHFNAYVYLDDGQNTVNADGMRDAIFVDQSGQTVNAGLVAADYTAVILQPGTGSVGNDVVQGAAATVATFDSSSGNSILGGAGELLFIGGTAVTATVADGGGPSYVFGGAGDLIDWTSEAGSYGNVFVAGAGNETLNAAAAQGNLAIFGYGSSDPGITAHINEELIGGSGNDSLVSGAGNETLMGGGGQNVFVIDATTDGVGAQITLGDFSASSGNVILFAHYTTAQIDSALAGAHTVVGALGSVNTVFTLSDSTTVTVIGVSTLIGRTFGG